MNEADRYYSVSKLKAIRNWFKTHPDGLVKTGCWTHPTMTRNEWTRWLRGCLMRKINHNEPCRGRKDNVDWRGSMRIAQRLINTPRAIVDWLPEEDLKVRFAHRLRSAMCEGE